MNHFELAQHYHEQGYNCCQSVLAAFGDVTGLDEKTALTLTVGMGRGANTGELCGAISGALLVLGTALGVDENDPVGSKRRAGAYMQRFQQCFIERFGALRCEPLLAAEISAPAGSEAEKRGITARCAILIATAVELTEQLLAEIE